MVMLSPYLSLLTFPTNPEPFVVIFPLYIIAPIFHLFYRSDDSELLFILLLAD